MASRADSGTSDDLRRRLLDAALELLQEPDTPLDLRKVAERAGKSRTAPYLVFGKGEGGGVMALRIAVAAEGARIMQRMMVEAYAKGGDPFASFERVATAFLDFVERNPRLFRLMYGPEINAIARLGEGGFREHPEFRKLLEHRDTAGQVVSELIYDAQDRGLLPGDPPEIDASVDERGGGATGGGGMGGGRAPGYHELPSVRYLQIAWATMIGVSVLREDDLLKAIGWDVSIEQGARLIAESVLGVDPGPAGEAMRTFLSSPQIAMSRSEMPTAPRMGFLAEVNDAIADLSDADLGPADLSDADLRAADPSDADVDVADVSDGPGGGGGGAPPRESTRESSERARRASEAAEETGVARHGPEMVAGSETPAPLLSARRSAGGTFTSVFRALGLGGRKDEPDARGEESTGDTRRQLRMKRVDTVARHLSSSRESPSLTDALETYPGLRRAAYSPKLLRGARLLWIDDHPAWVASVAETLRHLGADVAVVETTADAVRHLEEAAGAGAPTQVILSDIARGGDPQAGTDALPALRAVAPDTPVVFHIAAYEPERGVPDGAFGITNDVDELMHLVLDALEGREG